MQVIPHGPSLDVRLVNIKREINEATRASKSKEQYSQMGGVSNEMFKHSKATNNAKWNTTDSCVEVEAKDVEENDCRAQALHDHRKAWHDEDLEPPFLGHYCRDLIPGRKAVDGFTSSLVQSLCQRPNPDRDNFTGGEFVKS